MTKTSPVRLALLQIINRELRQRWATSRSRSWNQEVYLLLSTTASSLASLPILSAATCSAALEEGEWEVSHMLAGLRGLDLKSWGLYGRLAKETFKGYG